MRGISSEHFCGFKIHFLKIGNKILNRMNLGIDSETPKEIRLFANTRYRILLILLLKIWVGRSLSLHRLCGVGDVLHDHAKILLSCPGSHSQLKCASDLSSQCIRKRLKIQEIGATLQNHVIPASLSC